MFHRLARLFARDQRGQIALIFAAAIVPLFGLAAFGIDLTRAFVVKTHLQASIDAAALAASSAYGKPDDEIKAIGQKFFQRNYSSRDWMPPAVPVITVSDNVFKVHATVQLKTTVLAVFGMQDVSLYAETESISEPTGLEVALVVDVTHSMSTISSGVSRIESLRSAALDLVGILFDNSPDASLVKISIIPYNGTVNIGTASAGFVTGDDATNFPGTSWAGCVMARGGGYDVVDTYTAGNTSSSGGDWQAYKWPAEPNQATSGGAEHIGCVNPAGSSTAYKQVVDVFNQTAGYPAATFGPNRSCPDPVLPLTSNRADIEARINGLEVFSRTATMTSLGAVWGWRALSSDAPFTEGAAYEDYFWNKYIIILTDGRQNLSSQASDTGGACKDASFVNGTAWSLDPYVAGSWGNTISAGPQEQWTAYGYPMSSISLGSLGTYDDTVSAIESRLSSVCYNIKNTKRPNGAPAIGVYSITFGEGLSASDLADIKACASDASNYFHAPTGLSLEAAFSEIAYDILSTRITK
ncbi:MAG: TadE/TadG family type IV pilus assembly protein [Geminicoccaceae bacterium]